MTETGWSLAFCGDWAPTDGLDAALLANSEAFYGDLLPILRQADRVIVNLEGVLGETAALPAAKPAAKPIVKDGVLLRLDARLLAGLTCLPTGLACLANNHSFDYGLDGLQTTQKLLAAHGITSLGAGGNPEAAAAPWVSEIHGVGVGLLNAAEGEEGGAIRRAGVASLDIPRLQSQIHTLRQQTDLVIVVVHAGREHLPVPAPYITKAYRALVDAGANLVIGHHPHMPQGIETYHGAPIAYSLGNFALWMGTPVPLHSLGYVLVTHFEGRTLTGIEPIPYRIERHGLRLLKDAEHAQFLAELDELSALLVADHPQTIWEAYADQWLVNLGLPELLESTAELSGTAATLRAALKTWLGRFEGNGVQSNGAQSNGLKNRLGRSLLWRTIHHLEKYSPPKQPSASAAALLRNRFDTPAHRELALTALTRVMTGETGSAPAWASNLLEKWQVFRSNEIVG